MSFACGIADKRHKGLTGLMAIRIVRLGTPRHAKEGLRIGTVRHPPRGVLKKDYARRNYFDVWLPELAPSAPLVSWFFSEPLTAKRWTDYARRYRREMQKLSLIHI